MKIIYKICDTSKGLYSLGTHIIPAPFNKTGKAYTDFNQVKKFLNNYQNSMKILVVDKYLYPTGNRKIKVSEKIINSSELKEIENANYIPESWKVIQFEMIATQEWSAVKCIQ